MHHGGIEPAPIFKPPLVALLLTSLTQENYPPPIQFGLSCSNAIIIILTYNFLFSVHIKFKVATVPTSRVLPAALKANGLRNLPSIIHGEVAIDTVEEIIDYIDASFPTRINKINDPTLNESVDKLTRNFFSKFCFYIKSVSKDSTQILKELHRLDDLLKNTTTR